MNERIPPKERIFNMTREEILMSDPEDLMYYGYSEEDIWDAYETQKDNMRDCIDHGRNYHKSVYCYETDTVYHSGADAADELGCDRTAISQACSGKNHTANGYHVCFVEDKEDRLNNLDSWIKENHNYKSLHAKNLKTGEELYFESRKEASKTLGISDSCISLVIHGRIRQSHGWTFWED